VEVFVR
jgi:hypothetical protein